MSMEFETLKRQLSNAERQKLHRQKKLEEGLKAVTVYVPLEKTDEIKQIAKQYADTHKEIMRAKNEHGFA